MNLIDKFLGKDKMEDEPLRQEPERLTGKIIHLQEDEGWGFLDCKEIPFTRIFFHWTALTKDTLHFTKLEFGMRVEFTPIDVPDKGIRAIKVKVIEHE